jgi:glucose uptake protein
LLAVVAVVFDGKAYAGLEGSGRSTSRRSIGICLVSGVLMGLFAPLVTRALTTGAPLGPYTVAVCFTLGALVCCVPVNTYFMRRPLAGPPVTYADYAAAPWREHALGLLGGVVWGIGGVFNFVAASMVGVAIAYAIGQAAPMVAAAWGVVVWREFRGAPRRSAFALAAMFVCYLLAITVIARAYGA